MGQDQIEFATGAFIDEPVELQFAQGAEDGGHVAVRTGADDIEGLRKRSTDGSSAPQDGAEGIDLSRGPMGDIGEGAVVDLAVESERLAEEDGGRGVAIGDGGHIHAYIISIYYRKIKLNYNIYMTTH